MQLYPAMRASMGDWTYYIVRMTMREVAHEVQLASELWTDATLSDAIQRTVDASRVKRELVKFLSRRDDRFFSSLVVAAIGGNPSWKPVDSRFEEAFGELAFQVDPRYYALDGQHRLKAIKELMADPSGAPPRFASEQLSVIVVVREHQTADGDDRLWKQRYRRLFSSLNRYAKPTDGDTNIIMDEDDVFAIVTRRLIADHPFFQVSAPEKKSFRVQTRGKNLKAGAPHFTSLQTLYEMNQILLTDAEMQARWGQPRDVKVYLRFRPEEEEIDTCYRKLAQTWDSLLEAMPDLRTPPERMRTHQPPDSNPDGFSDHLAFWPIGQSLLAKIARSLLDSAAADPDEEPAPMVEALRPLADAPWDLHQPPWRYLLLVPDETKPSVWRMRSESRKKALEVAERLLRWLCGLDPLNEEEEGELQKDWRNLLYRSPEPTGDAPEEASQMWERVEAARQKIVVRGG